MDEARSNMRGDIWNGILYMVSGERISTRISRVSSETKIFNFSNFEVNTINAERNEIDASGVAQCVYNNDTLITFGGWDEHETFFDNFLILGGIFVRITILLNVSSKCFGCGLCCTHINK